MRLDSRSRALLWTGFFCISIMAEATGVARALIVNQAIAAAHAQGNGAGVALRPEATSVYTGLGITKKQAKQRAFAAMISSDTITRPQSGIGEADIVVEMEAAPGITRLMALFQSVLPEEIGSIRSARNDYIDLAAGFDSVLVHWGGEKRALDRLASSDTAELDQFANGDLFYRKLSVPAPHNGFTSGELMQEGIERSGYDHAPDFSAWKFAEDADLKDRPLGGTLDVTYGSFDFNVQYAYQPTSNTYVRSQAGVLHTDANTGEPASPKNVLVVRAPHFVYSDHGGYLQFDIQSGGDCALYHDGVEQKCKWIKGKDEDDPLRITDTAGKPLTFTAGQTWIQVVLPEAAVKWTPIPKTGTLETQTQ